MTDGEPFTNATHHPLYALAMRQVYEQRIAGLIPCIQSHDEPTCTALAGRSAWQECSGLYADDNALRNVLRQGKEHAERVFVPFFDRLLEAGCHFDKAEALALALYHAGCGKLPS